MDRTQSSRLACNGRIWPNCPSPMTLSRKGRSARTAISRADEKSEIRAMKAVVPLSAACIPASSAPVRPNDVRRVSMADETPPPPPPPPPPHPASSSADAATAPRQGRIRPTPVTVMAAPVPSVARKGHSKVIARSQQGLFHRSKHRPKDRNPQANRRARSVPRPVRQTPPIPRTGAGTGARPHRSSDAGRHPRQRPAGIRCVFGKVLVEQRGIEPLALSLRTIRSPN
jgi:hypothetical protein